LRSDSIESMLVDRCNKLMSPVRNRFADWAKCPVELLAPRPR
jgi:hypothetical protein